MNLTAKHPPDGVGAAEGVILGDNNYSLRSTSRLRLQYLTERVHALGPKPLFRKKHFKLSADKEEARALALRTFPKTAEHFSRKRDHNRAEASLLALYGAQRLLDVRGRP